MKKNTCKHGHTVNAHPSCFRLPKGDETANLLWLDIETMYGIWRNWNNRPPQYFKPSNMIKDWSILCWAAKKSGTSTVDGQSVTLDEVDARTEESILYDLWNLLDEAHIVITANGKRFDMPKINSKFIKHGYPEPSYFFHVDVLQVAWKRFGFTFNSLEQLARELGIDVSKNEMSYQDWIDCDEGTKKSRTKAMKKMLDYCKVDVSPLLEDVYYRMLPWIDNHPNMNLFTEEDSVDVCKNCGSTKLYWGEEAFTNATAWMGYRCGNCGTIGRGKKKEEKIKTVQIK